MGVTDHIKIRNYINDVCSQIKFRAVHHDIRLELETHLAELIEEYGKEGLPEDAAVVKAIEQMGTAEMVGQKLNMVHRTKPDWSLLALSFIFINMGLITMYFLEKYNLIPAYSIFSKSLLYAFLGGAALIGCYFLDYRKMAKHSYKIYGGTVLLLIWTMVFGLMANGQKIYLAIGPFSINTFHLSPIFFNIALAGILQKWDWTQPKKAGQGLALTMLPFLILINGALHIWYFYHFIFISHLLWHRPCPNGRWLYPRKNHHISYCFAYLCLAYPRLPLCCQKIKIGFFAKAQDDNNFNS